MITETAKMIYPDKAVADAIAAKLMQTKGKKYEVFKVSTGFQVCPITVCKAYVPPAKPLPVKKPSFNDAPSGDVVIVTMKFQAESPKYLSVVNDEGKLMHFGKGTLIDWEIEDNKTVKLKMSKAVAKKRGLI